MKKILVFLFILSFETSAELYSQSEIEIKTTGKYLYSWTIDEDETKARENARIGLLDTILVKMMNQSVADITDTVFIDVIDYFIKKVGLKWEVIAFADKSAVKLKLGQIKVISIVVGQHSVTRDTGSETDNRQPLKKSSTDNPLLDELLTITDAKALGKRLVILKNALRLNYGDRSNYPDEKNCFVFVIDKEVKNVVAVYGRVVPENARNSRINLLTGQSEENIVNKHDGQHLVYVVFN